MGQSSSVIVLEAVPAVPPRPGGSKSVKGIGRAAPER
jgi:hypothetical protein